MNMYKNLMRVTISGLVVCLLGCGYKERRYESLSHVNSEGDLSIASALSIPEDAVSISFRSDAESGHYFASYDTKRSADYIQERRLLAASARQDKSIRSSIGFGVVLPKSASLYYRCSSSLKYHDEPNFGSDEISLLGVAGRKVYQWNKIHDEKLTGELCRNDR